MRFTILPALLAGALVGTACSDSTASRISAAAPASLDKGGTQTHAIELYAVLGTGSGGVNVTPTAEDQGTLHVQGEVHVVGAPPNTTYLVQRAPDLNVGDPTCTGPWISFPVPNAGPLVTLTTSAGGSGAAHFEVGVGGRFTSGTPFNVRFRVIDNLQSPTSILMTDCVTVVVK
jgi:hypothetical protein